VSGQGEVEAMHVIGSGHTDTGRVRANNEDCFASDDRLSLYLVADGMGGHAAGEVASRIAVDTVVEEMEPYCGSGGSLTQSGQEPVVPEDVLRSAFMKANRAIRDAASTDRARQGMGTTLTAAWCVNDSVVVSHVGDSRAYLFRKYSLERLTRDHRLVTELPAHEGQSEYTSLAHVLTRALGPGPDIDVDTVRVSLQNGDRILLCSDGLHSELDDEGILSIVHAAGGPSQACRELVGTANRLGGRDNITAVVICAYSSFSRVGVRELFDWILNRVRTANRGTSP